MVCMIDAVGARVGERADHWRQVIYDRFGVDADFHPLGNGEFRQSMAIEELGNVVVGERTGSPFLATQQANGSDMAVACLTVAGHCDFRQGNEDSLTLSPGSLMVFPLRDAIASHFADSTHHLFIACPASALAEQCPEWMTLARTPLDQSRAPVRMLLDLTQSILRHSEGLGAHCRSAGGNLLVNLLASSLAATEEGEASQSTRMQAFHRQRIRNHVLTHLCDPHLDATSIADGVRLSLRYVHRLFASEPLHLMQWVLEQRLARCHEALRANGTTTVSISQIAYRWGFNDAAHFSRVFRNRFGLSPREVADHARRPPN